MVVFVIGRGEGRFEQRATLETLNAQVVRAEWAARGPLWLPEMLPYLDLSSSGLFTRC